MKKLYTLVVFALFSIVGNGQIVNIPDPEFKFYLLNDISEVNSNHDNEIQLSEALAITQLNIQSGTITDLTGLEAFINLTSLTVSNISGVTTIDVSALTALATLSINDAPITSINLSTLTNLTNLRIGGSNIVSLAISDFSGLKVLDLYQNNLLTTLALASLPSLEELYTNECTLLTDFDITGLATLKKLSCTYNWGRTTLDLTGLSNLETVNCSNSRNLSNIITTGAIAIKSFDCSHCKLASLNVSGMLLLQLLNCSSNFGNGPGIEVLNLSGLTQLTNLDCSENRITVLDVSSLINLKYLACNYNLLTTLNVAPLVNLISLDAQGYTITSLNLQTLPNLKHLSCAENPLGTIDVSGLVNLETFYCWDNGFSTLNLSNLNNLRELYCMNNQLTTLDLAHQTKLEKLTCGRNLLESIDLSTNENFNTASSGLAFYSFDFSYSQNLKNINLKFGTFNPFFTSFSFAASPNLRFICTDEANISSIAETLVYEQITNVEINSYCNFEPGGIFNTITGVLNYDSNNNGCDITDLPAPLLKVTINDGTDSGATFSNTTGQYSFYTNEGTFVLSPVFENPYFTISPSSATINFATLDGTTQNQNFCIAPLGIHYDVEISIVPMRGARPGFDTEYKIMYKNKGNQILSGSIDLNFDDAILDFVSANPNNDSQFLNHLQWNYSALYPFESREINLILNLNSPQEIPAVNIGDILHYVTTISVNGQDETPADTVFNLDQTVIGSFDPNDKTCLEGNTITPEMVGKYLHYLIRFQNSGTAAAENIVVKDIIDTTKFDIASLQLTSSSHPQVTKITGNKVEFQFENINLPAEIDNELASHGYIAFKIKTKNNLVIGNSVSNKADIYFDYNFPIETNTANSTVALLGVNTFENTSVNVTPNPTKNMVHISSKSNITSVQLFDVQGRVLETITTNNEAIDFDLSQKSSGVYFVKVYTAKGVKVEKVIKE